MPDGGSTGMAALATRQVGVSLRYRMGPESNAAEWPPHAGSAAILVGAFSAQLLSLHRLGRRRLPEQFMTAALTEFRSLIDFAGAWWGECSDHTEATPPINWQHGSIGLALSLAHEWNDISEADEFGLASMRSPGVVCRSSGHESASLPVEQFSRRHDLFHAMAMTLELPDSGLMFFVSLYRGESRPVFDDLEASVFGEYCRHLVLRWQENLSTLLRSRSMAGSDAFALCNAAGILVYVGASVARIIRREYPNWQGTQLPALVTEQLAKVPFVMRVGQDRIEFAACGSLVALSLDPGTATSPLPPREHAVALLYAAGSSYKEIARQLGLSPATVRTYLRNAYMELGVRNKVELGSRLDGEPKRQPG
ncbi:MAG: LuxR C-terminal-related transcriptional regulator [Burkholderiales bacterium]